MKKRNLLLLPLFMLVLAGCTKPPVASSEEPPVTSTEPITDDSEELPSVSEEPPTSVDETVITSIKDARPQEGTAVTVQGVATAVYGMAGGKFGAILQQDDHAITLPFLLEADLALFAIGDVVQASGTIKTFNGLIQLDTPTVKKVDVTMAAPVAHVLTTWDQAAMEGMDARWVKVEGLQKVGGVIDPTKNSPIDVKFPGEATTFQLYMSGYIATADKEALATKINDMGSTDTINFEGPLGRYNNFQLNPVNEATVTIVKGEPPVGPVLPTSLTFTPATAELAPGATFATTLVKAPSDATLEGLTYTSADEAVATVSETGVITAVASGTTTITAQVGEVKATFVVNVPIIDDTITLLNSFNFLDGGDSGNNGYANTDVKTNVSYADNNPGGVTDTTEWEADYSNLSLDYGTRLGGKLESEVQTDAETPWANIKTLFTFEAEIKKVEILGSVYFGSNNITGLYLQYSADGSTWNTVGELATPAELSKSAAGNPGITISFNDLSIPANSFLRFGVSLTAATSNSGLQFTGIQVYTAAN